MNIWPRPSAWVVLRMSCWFTAKVSEQMYIMYVLGDSTYSAA